MSKAAKVKIEDRIAAEILQAIQVRGELPAMTRVVDALSKNSQTDKMNVQELTRWVLSDYALTSKILRVVNSAMYNQPHEVTTVSRAVILLGWNAICNLAMTFKLFDGIPKGQAGDRMREVLGNAFVAASVARHAVIGSNYSKDSEQAFICSLFHSFGDLLMSFYIPKEEEQTAATIQAVAQVVAEELHLPDLLILSMKKSVPVKVKGRADSNEFVANLAPVSHQIAQWMRSDMSKEEVQKRTDEALDKFSKRVGQVRIKSSELLESAERDMRILAQELDMNLSGIKLKEAGAGPEPSERQPELKVLEGGVSECLNTLKNKNSSLGEVVSIALETMFRGLESLGVVRVLFMFSSPDGKILEVRHGMGDISKELKRWFRIQLQGNDDIFGELCKQKKDIALPILGDAKNWSELPRWYRERGNREHYFVLLPMHVANKPVGAFVIEGKSQILMTKSESKTFTKEQLDALRTLRDHVVLSVVRATRADPI